MPTLTPLPPAVTARRRRRQLPHSPPAALLPAVLHDHRPSAASQHAGKAEAIRLLLAAAGVEFENKLVALADLAAEVKANSEAYPFGQLPRWAISPCLTSQLLLSIEPQVTACRVEQCMRLACTGLLRHQRKSAAELPGAASMAPCGLLLCNI